MRRSARIYRLVRFTDPRRFRLSSANTISILKRLRWRNKVAPEEQCSFTVTFRCGAVGFSVISQRCQIGFLGSIPTWPMRFTVTYPSLQRGFGQNHNVANAARGIVPTWPIRFLRNVANLDSDLVNLARSSIPARPNWFRGTSPTRTVRSGLVPRLGEMWPPTRAKAGLG